MDLNKLTLKSQEALRTAQQQAAARNNAQVEPAHLLFALLADPEGVITALLHRVGQSPRSLRDRAGELLDRLPKVYGGQEVGLSAAFLLARSATRPAATTAPSSIIACPGCSMRWRSLAVTAAMRGSSRTWHAPIC